LATHEVHVRHDALDAFIRRALAARGVREAHAAIIADTWVWADLHGVDSHGVAWLPVFTELLDRGAVNIDGEPSVTVDEPARVLVDGNGTAGPVAMLRAIALATDRAIASGSCVASVRHCTHTGPVGRYAAWAADHGCAAILMVAGPPFMAYHGARVASLATSPIAMAVPGPEGDPILLDIATSTVAFSKLRHARLTGQPVPPGWAMDTEGNMATDPAKAMIPLPLGGHKGSGLSFMIELIASVMTGNPILADYLGPDATRRHSQNALAILIKADAYRSAADFARDTGALATIIRGLPRAVGVDEIRLPGERAARLHRERQAHGIPLPAGVWSKLRDLAAAHHIDLPPVEAA